MKVPYIIKSDVVVVWLAQIEEEGPLTVARFMDLALTHADHGYYMHRDVFGRTGDFVTAPEVSQLFGEIIALWFVQQCIIVDCTVG